MKISFSALSLLFLLLPQLLYAKHNAGASDQQVARAEVLPVLVSPNKKLRMQLQYDPAKNITYTFVANSKTLIKESQIGLKQPAALAVPVASRRSVNAVWKPIWGKRAVVPEKYNELTLDLKTYKIIVRAYDDGIAFRYEYPAKNAATELTTFDFAGNYTAWYYNGENHNIGPEKLVDCDATRLPVMTIKVDSATYLALHEADLATGEPLVLQSKKGETRFTIASKTTTAWR